MTTNTNMNANNGGRDQAAPKATPDLDKNNQQMKPPSQVGTSGNRDVNAGQAGKDSVKTTTTPQNQNAPKPQDQNKQPNKPGAVTDDDAEDESDDESEDDADGKSTDKSAPVLSKTGSNAQAVKK